MVLLSFISCKTRQSTDEITLISASHRNASCVFMTTDQDGMPAISWAETDSASQKHFYMSRWDTLSGRFGQKINIPIPQSVSLHEEGMPKIAFKGDGSILATFETSTPVPGARFGKGDVQYSISQDNGKTWTKAVSVKDGYPDAGSIGFSNVTRLNDGEIGIAWLGTGPATVVGRPVIFAKTTKDGGFTKGAIVDSVACQCCRIALCADENNRVYLAFRNLLAGNVRDISIAGSEDNGQTFSRPVSFSGDNWIIEGCPHDGPAVVSNGDKTFATWYAGSSSHEGAGIYYAEMDKENKTLLKKQISATGKFIQLCLMPDGSRIMGYNESYREGDSIFNKIMVAKANGDGFYVKELTAPGSRGFYPMVAPVSNERAVIAWKDEGRIFYRTVATADITIDMPDGHFHLPVIKGLAPERIKVSNDIDPVCGMKIKDQMARDTTMRDGRIIGFCSPECKHIFNEE